MTRNATRNEDYIVKPLANALGVLGVLSAAGRSMSLRDIAAASGTSKTTVFRYLQTLALMGFVSKQPAGDYTLGPAAFALAREDNRDATLKSAALGEMQGLAAEFGERVSLGAPKGKRIYYISMIENDSPLRLRAESGDADYFHSTALGKAMIAFMPKEKADLHLNSRLTRFTAHTLTTRRQLDQALSLVRKYGFAIDREENEVGCVCYAAPIFGWGETPVAAISVSVPISRLTADLDVRIPDRVRQRARAITTLLRQDAAAAPNPGTFKSHRGAGGASG
ncbi:MAG: IclR family transcriptional regulator [Alphaproteobacteria bacterium]|nr:IclR family transcriptional regulator [Alphaproteobacteria bacterium]